MSSTDDPTPGGKRLTSRREVVKAGVAASLVIGGAVAAIEIADDADAATPPAADACVLTPEFTAGPFYVPEELIREDITEGKAGLPLELRITVTEVVSCTPLAGAAVDIWHCDADGYYSGVEGANPGDPDSVTTTQDNIHTTFMRGVQLTDEAGIVRFRTVYPGWYRGRAIHIHLAVHLGGDVEPADDDSVNAGKGDVYVGGREAHTGQLFFDEAVSDEVAMLEPYLSRGTERTRLEDDRVFRGHEPNDPGFFLDLERVDPDDLRKGLIGTITLFVNAPAGS